MPKFTLNTGHFITPIKLILPGIIVSLFGASAGYFIFNNPDKNKAKQTYASWNVIRDYEKEYLKCAEEAMCLCEPFDQFQFQKDLAHHMGVLIQHLEDLTDEELVDMRLKAFLNLKIARYTEEKRLTDGFLDSVIIYREARELSPDDQVLKEASQGLAMRYSMAKGHVETRDTNELKRIALALNKDHTRYTDSFLLDLPRDQPLADIRHFIPGRWVFPEFGSVIEFKKDSTGFWEDPGVQYKMRWSMKGHTVTIDVENEKHSFYIMEATLSKLSALWKNRNQLVLIGCRELTRIELKDRDKR